MADYLFIYLSLFKRLSTKWLVHLRIISNYFMLYIHMLSYNSQFLKKISNLSSSSWSLHKIFLIVDKLDRSLCSWYCMQFTRMCSTVSRSPQDTHRGGSPFEMYCACVNRVCPTLKRERIRCSRQLDRSLHLTGSPLICRKNALRSCLHWRFHASKTSAAIVRFASSVMADFLFFF